MKFSVDIFSKITRNAPNENMASMVAGLTTYGVDAGLDKPHRFAHFAAQLCHESGAFKYDRELWGPTPAQARYDTRTNLGNTAAVDGDGKKFMGRSALQLTGRANYRSFTTWCQDNISVLSPDFDTHPDLINTDPWEGLVPIWFWTTRTLNKYADQNDIEMVTRRINGGLNGYADRMDWYVKSALVLLDRGPTELMLFQKATGLVADGIPGPRTRAALHGALLQLGTSSWSFLK